MENEFYIDYAKLDDFQRQLVDRKVNKSMVITGSAGSGKSVIALHKAKQISSLGSYAVIVFTKTLKKYFNDGLESLNLSNVYHYNGWPKNKVDYLIVDECQDFSPSEIDEMCEHANICFFFGDTEQSIMGFRGPLQKVEETAHKLGISATPLYFNYRLTKEVAALAEKVGKVEDIVEKCKREGEKPQIILKNSIDEQLDEIIRLIRNKSLTNVGILMPFNTKAKAASRIGNEKISVEYVKDYFSKHGEPNEFKYNANQSTEMDLDFHSSNPKIMTWWCAKGLQFKDVFLPCCEIKFEEEKRSAIYVAMTRCSEHLYLCYSNTLSPFFPNPDSDLYANNNDDEII
ncbi:superfamily I DNA/RNA helicase [Parabacteroides sp. PFB2-10]|uniref:DNA/RNA helicase domain-containing protein n=1 Tax=Parabacteroides sp. PFB2-10 TaxID=1742405 RepID=UPI002476D727|nr:DNA/RNA helicase domain-containing protein [Parabacteroides sp. PFB2-10]MDH6313907.1 superfamily I DNA/RNA helicase [Parabacteroides sp. PFB2-10]